MSTDFGIRPAGAPAVMLVAPVSHAATGAVATELPASQVVTAADGGGHVRSNLPSVNDQVSHQAIIDSAAASIVYQVIDTKTNLVVDQFPDEAVLRRRAYFRALDLSKSGSNRQLATDVRA